MTEAEQLAQELEHFRQGEVSDLLRAQAAEIESLKEQVTTQHDVLMRKDHEIKRRREQFTAAEFAVAALRVELDEAMKQGVTK